MMSRISRRLASIDVLRAITMLLMIFVNDLELDERVPRWLEHAKEGEDRLGLADTVFPAFLFIVGIFFVFLFVLLAAVLGSGGGSAGCNCTGGNCTGRSRNDDTAGAAGLPS